MDAFKFQQDRFSKASKHLALGFLHFSHLHHLPADIAAKFNDATLQHVDAFTAGLAVEVLGVTPINHQAGRPQVRRINREGLGQAGHPNHHIGLGQGFIEAEDPPTPEFDLQVNQGLLLPGHQQKLLHPRALA